MTATDRTPSQTESTYLRLRDDLLTCRIKPGQKLIITDLTARLGVNLSAVREALSRLTSEGLVTSESQRGFRAAPVSLSDLLDLTKTRIQIETLCLESALPSGDVEWEARIVSTYHRLVRTPEFDATNADNVSEAWGVAHSDFHAALVGACESKWLLNLRALLYAQSERYRRMSIPMRISDLTLRQNHKANQEQDHKLLMEAALSRDIAKTSAIMAKHLQHTANLVRIFMDKQNEQGVAGTDQLLT